MFGYSTKFDDKSKNNNLTDECEQCQKNVNPFNIQIRKYKKIQFDKNKFFYYDSETEYSDYTSDSDLVQESDVNDSIDNGCFVNSSDSEM